MQFSTDTVYLHVKDYSVSGESFDLLLDEELQLLKTHPQPSLENLPKYYESDDYISHTDGSRSLFEKVYQLIKRKAIRDKVSLITKLQPQKGMLLDIGAGTRIFFRKPKIKTGRLPELNPMIKLKRLHSQKAFRLPKV